MRDASPEIFGCTIVGNSALQGGGVLITGVAGPQFERTIAAFNSGEGGIVCDDPGSSPTFSCCDAFGNEGSEYGGLCTDPTGTDGNISEDPLFCDVYGDDLTLCANSPCLPEGNDCIVLMGALAGGCPDCSSGVEETTSWGAVKALFR